MMNLRNPHVQKITALFLSISFILLENVGYALPISSIPLAVKNPSLVFPGSLGSIEESFRGTSSKTIIYIQDAHDSLDAQENIAKLIEHLVGAYPIRTVYEEGEEGPVPTDAYFGFIRDADLKHKISAFLLDRLRIGGAEYAHINRSKNFNLLGIDSRKLHEENLKWYREALLVDQEIQQDLERLRKRLDAIADRYLTPSAKRWLKDYRRYENGNLPFDSYLRESMKEAALSDLPEKRFPRLYLFYRFLRGVASPDEMIQAQQLKAEILFKELNDFSLFIAETLIRGPELRPLFNYLQGLDLLEKLRGFKMAPEEFRTLQSSFQNLKTEAIARFVYQITKRPVVLSKAWESYIENAVQFYKTAEARDGVIARHLQKQFLPGREDVSILVFGGFHKDGIRRVLKKLGLSYIVIRPAISEISKRHQAYYREIMTEGRLHTEISNAVRKATSQPHIFRDVSAAGFPDYLKTVLPTPLNRRLRSFLAAAPVLQAAGVSRSEARLARVPYPATNLRIGMAQMSVQVGDMVANYRKALDYYQRAKAQDVDILVFPELTLPGYLPEDLVYKQHFIRQNKEMVKLFAKQVRDLTVVIGFIDSDEDGRLYNAAAIISDGEIKGIYHKWDLPNYGVFDEKRFFAGKMTTIFTPQHTPSVFWIKGLPVSINICEDIWNDRGEGLDVYMEEAKLGAKLQINISASPFHIQKIDVRRELLKRRTAQTGSVMIYANLLGGQDEVVFDGGSMIMAPDGQMIAQGNQFQEELIVADVDLSKSQNELKKGLSPVVLNPSENSSAKIPLEPREVPQINSPTQEIYEVTVMAIRDYMRKNNFKKVVLGLSGGIDSAVTAALAVAAVGRENVKGISMPTRFNSEGTKTDARQVAEALGIEFKEIPIQGLFDLYLQTLERFRQVPLAGPVVFGVSEENLQARIRGNILMYESNQTGALLLTTGNKSETAVGYATLYGDMAGGFAPIKDVYKTEVFELARYINQREGREIIPESTITRPPSAELNEGQFDEKALLPYPQLDEILRLYLEHNASIDELAKVAGRDQALRIVRLVERAEYKRRQAPPGPKLTRLAFGRDRRMPISQNYREHEIDQFLQTEAARAEARTSLSEAEKDRLFRETLDASFVDRPMEEAEKSRIRERIRKLNPDYPDQDKLLHMMKWDPAQFRKKHRPSVVGQLQNPERFSDQKGLRILDMAIRMPGKGWAIPEILAQFAEPLQKAVEHERAINPRFDEEYYVYITVDQKVIEPGKSQRRPGAHGDAFVTRETNDLSQEVITDNTYIISDRAEVGTFLFEGPFPLEGIDLNEDAAVLRHFDEIAATQKGQQATPYQLIRLTPYDIHAVAQNQTGKPLTRTFVKIQFSRDKLNMAGNTLNRAEGPDGKPLFDYSDWVWVARDRKKRNNRNSIIDWNRPDAEQFELINPAAIDFSADRVSFDWAEPEVFWAKKVEGVHAEPAQEGETLETVVRGDVITINISQKGDWKITTSQGDQYFLSDAKFRERYFVEYGRNGFYLPRPNPVRMIKITKPVRFRAPWSAWQYLSPGSAFAKLTPHDVYGIHRENFNASYRKTDVHGNVLADDLINAAFVAQPMEAEKQASLRQRIRLLNPDQPEERLFHVQTWRMNEFNQPHLPVVIGELQDKEGPGHFTGEKGIRFLDLLIYAPGQGWAIPQELRPFREVLKLAIESERLVNPDWTNRFVHITVDQKRVPPDKPGRRPGLHMDTSLFDNQGNQVDVVEENIGLMEQMEGWRSDHAYIFHDALPTAFYRGPFPVEQIRTGRRYEELVAGHQPVTYPNYTLLRLNAYDVHTAVINNTGTSVRRTFFKLQFTERLLDRPINSLNPFLNYDLARAISKQRSEVREEGNPRDQVNVARLNEILPKGYPARDLKNPPHYTASNVLKNARGPKNPNGWAHPDLENPSLAPAEWHRIVEAIRASIMRFEPQTRFDPETGLPVNGEKTGLKGRGRLGRYGPNPAEDAVVLRYNKKGELEVLTIDREDGGGLALPGGMIREGEENRVGHTASRELEEETNLSIDLSGGRIVYQGMPKDPRDTDNAWMITRGVAVLLSWEDSRYLKPRGGSDAKKRSARFVKITDDLTMYADHRTIVDNAVQMIRNGQISMAGKEIVSILPRLDLTLSQLEEAYQLFKEGKNKNEKVYDITVPKTPHGGSYAVFAGLEETLSAIRRRRFSPEHIAHLKKLEKFSEEFLEYLRQFIFEGDVDALEEGSVVSQGVPLLRIKATPVEMTLLKGLIQNRIGFSTNIATKTARIVQAANGEFVTPEAVEKLRQEQGLAEEQIRKPRAVLDFGQRRGQGKGSTVASLAAVIGGAIATSNVKAAKQFYLDPSGTMAHLFISLFPPEKEIEAFRVWGKIYPKSSVFLLDTYDTIEAAKKAVIVAKAMEQQGGRLLGVRLDSGDLVKLSQEVRKIFDDAGLQYVKIFASDDLDEYKITDLISKGARIDGFGVGTNLITGGRQATLKLEITESEGERYWRARHRGKFTRYIRTAKNRIVHARYEEEVAELLRPFWRNGKRYFDAKKPWKAHERVIQELAQFKPEHKRLENFASLPVESQADPLTINPETDAILVIDAQKAFMKTGGLAVKEGDDIMPHVRELLQRFPKNRRFASVDKHPRGHISWASSFVGIPAFTYLTYDTVKDWTPENHKIAPHALFTLEELKAKLQKIGGQMLWPDHAGYGTFEAQLHPDLLERELEYVVAKGMDPKTDSYSAFFDNEGNPTGLAEELRKRGIRRLFVVGLAYDYCVGWSAEGAIKEGFEVAVVKEGTRPVGFPPDSIEKMDRSFREKGIQVVSVKEVLQANDHRGVYIAKRLEQPIAHPDFPDEEGSSAFEEDMYHISMGQALFLSGLYQKEVTFDYFFRKPPYGENHITVSGTRFFLESLEKFRFSKEQIEYLKHIHELSSAAPLHPEFIEFLRNYRFKGTILGMPEGSVAFPQEPILRVEGTIFDAMIIETLILKRLNFNSLEATWANVIRKQHGQKVRLIEDGLEGAQGIAHQEAAYSVFLGGVDATTNLDAAFAYGLPLAHKEDQGIRLGPELVTGGPKSALGGVYKLVQEGRRGIVKLSNDPGKSSWPGKKQVVEIVDASGHVVRRVTKLEGEKLGRQPGQKIHNVLKLLVQEGNGVYESPDIFQLRAFHEQQETRLAHVSQTEFSPRLRQLQQKLVARVRRSEVRTTAPKNFVQESELTQEEVAALNRFATEAMDELRKVHDEFIIKGFGQSRKEDDSVVTEVDYAIQQRFLEFMLKRFPRHHLIGEETLRTSEASANERNAASDYQWILDAIDGTKSFGEGDNYYAITFALYYKGRPVLAQVYSPSFGLLETSQDQPHVYLNHMPIQLNPQDPLPVQPRGVVPGRGSFPEKLRQLILTSDFFQKRGLQTPQIQLKTRSVTVNLANIIRGHFQFFVSWNEQKANIWDIAAIAYLLVKAGRQIVTPGENGQWQPLLERFHQELHGHYHFIAGSQEALDLLKGLVEKGGWPGEAELVVPASVSPTPEARRLPADIENISSRTLPSGRPFAAIFDLHGILTETTWKHEYSVAYAEAAGVSLDEAKAWVNANAHEDLNTVIPQQTGISAERFQEILGRVRTRERENYQPKTQEGALEFVRVLVSLNVPVFVLTGSRSDIVLKQLRQAGFADFIPAEHIITRDRIETFTGKADGTLKDRLIRSLHVQFPRYTFLHFSDSPGGYKAIHEIGGFNFGSVLGEGEEFEANRKKLLGLADFLMRNGLKNFPELLAFLQINTALQYQNPTLPTADYEAKKLDFVVPSLRRGGLALHIKVSDDLKSVTYSEVLDDSQVFRWDGRVDYSKLKLRPVATFPSSYLVSPVKHIEAFAPAEVFEAIGRLWPQHKRYTEFRGVTTSWDRESDNDVWSFNIDSGYMLQGLLAEGFLKNLDVKRVAEVGVGGGQVSAGILPQLPHLEKLVISDISSYALSAAIRNILPFLPQGAQLIPFLGKGIKNFPRDLDLLIVNPPYIPTHPNDKRPATDPYRGTGLIREIVAEGFTHLNPRNPKAAVVINISSLASKDFRRYVEENKDRITVEPLGPSLHVPLKIRTISEAWKKWLVQKGLLEEVKNPAPGQEKYWHHLQNYIIHPKTVSPAVQRSEARRAPSQQLQNEKITVLVDLKVFEGLSKEQRVEFYKSFEAYRSQEVRFVFENPLSLDIAPWLETELKALRQDFPRTVKILANGFSVKDAAEGAVVSISSQNLDSEDLKDHFAARENLIRRFSKRYLFVRYSGIKKPGLLSAALLLLQSEAYPQFQYPYLSEIPPGLEDKIETLLGNFVYVGRSA